MTDEDRDAGPTVRAVDATHPGERLDFETFVSTRKVSLMRTAALLTAGRHSDAEDLLQATLVKLYLAWDRAALMERPDAYARRTLVNEFLSRRRRAEHRRERLVAASVEPASLDPGPEDHLMLWPHVAALPPRQRAVIVLRYYCRCDEREIADLLGMAPGTVKSTAAAALASLRRHLEEER